MSYVYHQARQRNTETPTYPCHICVQPDHVWRHKHWAMYDGDLASHLRESLPPLLDGKPDDGRIGNILQWVHAIRVGYGGTVNEHGSYLSAWEARRDVNAQYAKTYARPPEPRTERGRKITFRAFLHLLTATKSQHAKGWLNMLQSQFTEADMADEGRWSDFVKFMHEYEISIDDPDNAEFLERVDVRPVVKMAGAGR